MSLLNGALTLTSKKIHLPGKKKKPKSNTVTLVLPPYKSQWSPASTRKRHSRHYGTITEKWRHHAFTVILAQGGSQPLIVWWKMQSFLWRKDDCANTAFLSFMRELNMQAGLLLDTRTAPGLQPFKQLFQHLDFTRNWLRAYKPQKQHLNCIFPCMATSEQGWNCSWLPQSSAKATHKSQIIWGRSDFFSPDSLQFIVLTKESSSLLPLCIHKTIFLMSPWARYTGFAV